jgi:plastocyanin
MSKKRFQFLLLVLATLAISSILLAACARPGTPSANTGNTGTPGSGKSSGGEPTVHMGPSNFVQSSVDVPKGSKLMLIDDGSYLHILANGSWVNGSPRSSQEPGAPAVNNIQVNSGTVEIGPFTTAGTFHIYCSVHQNMNLVITVK